MSKFNQVTFTSNVGEFTNLLTRVKELTKVAETGKVASRLRIFPTGELMLYSVVGEPRKIAKMKVGFMKVQELFKQFPKEVSTVDYIIEDSSKWFTQYSFLTPSKADVNGEIKITLMLSPDAGEVFKFIASNGELELHSVGGDNSIIRDELIRNATTEMIKRKLSADNGIWQVSISEKQLDDMKKLSKLDTEDIVTASVENGVVKIYQRLWHQTFPVSVSAKNGVWHFDRSNLKAIGSPAKNCSVILSVADDFMVVHEQQSDFMFALELHD